MKRSKLWAALTALMLILAACTSAGDTTTTADGGGGGTSGGKLAAVKAADKIVCGVNDGLPGFGVVDAQGPHGAEDRTRYSQGRRPAGSHSDQSRSELAELGKHEAMDSLADGSQKHHRCDSDCDAEESEDRA